MLIVVDSLTGLSRKFAKKLGYEWLDIDVFLAEPREGDIFLVTRCHGFGEVPEATRTFLQKYSHQVVALACSGNRNWGKNFGAAGFKIEEEYGIEYLLRFEASGFPQDVEKVKKYIEKYLEK